MTVPIECIKAVDGTATGSHTALVVAEDEGPGRDLIEGMNITGETLVVQTPSNGGVTRRGPFRSHSALDSIGADLLSCSASDRRLSPANPDLAHGAERHVAIMK